MNLPQNQNFQKNKKELKKFSFESNFRLVYISVALFFAGFFLCTFYGFQTMIPLSSFLRVFIFIVVGAYLIQHFILRPVFPMKQMEYLMFSIFGIGPMLSAVFLMLNFYIHTEEFTKEYKLHEVSNKNQYQYFEVDGIPCDRYPELCVVHEDDLHLREGEIVKITVAKGLFGYRVITNVSYFE